MSKGGESTAIDDAAYGAHQGMTVKMEHTKDPLMDDTANRSTTMIH